MESVLHVLGIAVLLGICLAAVLSIVVGVPGTLVILVVAVLYAWATDFAALQWSTIGWLAGLAAVGEGVEFLASGLGATAAGGGKPSPRVFVGALVGSIVGGILCAPLLFGLGALLGALAGAFAGAAAAVSLSGGTVDAAFSTGLAALRGRLLGFVVKTAVAVVMVIVVFAAVV